MVLPPKLLGKYLKHAKHYNQTASKIEQLALSDYIKSGQLERQLRRLRKLYSAKSSLLIQSLKDTFGKNIEILLEETLLSVILTVKTNYSSSQICDMAEKNGVKIMPVKNSDNIDGTAKVMLGFAGIPVCDIKPAVERLKKAWYFG